jgi:hypothetical protein
MFVMAPDTIVTRKEAKKILKYKGFIIGVPANVKYTRTSGTNNFQNSKRIEISWN